MTRNRTSLLVTVMLSLLAQVIPGQGLAQTSGAAIQTLDPSIRASGMGGASAAVFWGGDPNDWANPGLLGYHRGVSLTHGRTQLVPDLADDVFLKTDRITLGLWGVGVSLVGRPFKGLGRARLDLGESMATDGGGFETGMLRSYEDLYSFGLGVNLIESTENAIARRLHSPHPISRYGDISLGYAMKKVDVQHSPQWAGSNGGFRTGSVKIQDAGLVVRLTPINTIDDSGFPFIGEALTKATKPLGGLRLDVAYGRSKQNVGRRHIAYVEQEQPDPIVRTGNHGWAVRGALGLPPFAQEPLKEAGLGFLAEGLTPLIQIGVAWDRSHVEWPDWNEPDVRNRGWEITIANVYTLRRGHIEDKSGPIIDDTSGWGLGFQVGRFGGFRYDRAVVPQATALDDVKRAGFTVFVCPLEIIAAR
jgi:hypothetical protein